MCVCVCMFTKALSDSNNFACSSEVISRVAHQKFAHIQDGYTITRFFPGWYSTTPYPYLLRPETEAHILYTRLDKYKIVVSNAGTKTTTNGKQKTKQAFLRDRPNSNPRPEPTEKENRDASRLTTPNCRTRQDKTSPHLSYQGVMKDRWDRKSFLVRQKSKID